MATYTDEFVGGIEWLWGEGYLSPGGTAEIAEILRGVDIRNKTLLDIGCGLGVVDRVLVKNHGAGKITAIDVVPYLLERARRDSEKDGLQDQIEYLQVEPGPFLFDDEAFDVVFSKDAIVHIEDKRSFYKEIYRVLKPGGILVGCDWLGSDNSNNSEDLRQWQEFSTLVLFFWTAPEMEEELRDIGYQSISTRDRNEWYKSVVRDEIARVSGENRTLFIKQFGKVQADFRLKSSSLKLKVVEAGNLRPTHFRARKP